MVELIENKNQEEKFEVAISDDRLIEIAERAEQRIDAVIKIKRIALKVTNPNDWIDQKGKPYLAVSGAEKVARLFGISWMIDEPTYEEDKDGHFRYTYTGLFSFENVSIQAVGTRNSKDAFFSRTHGNDIPPSEIDKPNVKKAAYTNLVGNGITRLLGIRNLTYEDLKTANITKDKITSIQYKTKGKPQKSSQDSKKGSSVKDKEEDKQSPSTNGEIDFSGKIDCPELIDEEGNPQNILKAACKNCHKFKDCPSWK